MDIGKCRKFRAPKSILFQRRTPKGASALLDNSLRGVRFVLPFIELICTSVHEISALCPAFWIQYAIFLLHLLYHTQVGMYSL